MTHGEQIEAFQNDLEAVIDRYRKEFDLPLGSVIGTIELVKLDLRDEELQDDE